MQTLVQTTAFSIARADASDMRACRMLLPHTFTPTNAPETLVALDRSGALIGAAAVGWEAVGDPAALPVAIHVIPPWRRHGVGRALIDSVTKLADGEAPALQPWTVLQEGSDAAAFCLAVGFTVDHRVLHFESEVEIGLPIIASYHEKLRHAGRIPTDSCVVPLHAAPAGDVARLISVAFHASPTVMLARLRGETDTPFEPKRSVVLLLGGRVVGAHMVTIASDGIPTIEAHVVSQRLRGGWANALLLHEAARIAFEQGSGRYRFVCDERTTAVVGMARRIAPEPARKDLALIRPV